MRIIINSKFLVVPTSSIAEKRRMMVELNGEVVYSFNICYDDTNIEYFAYVDVSKYLGKELDVTLMGIQTFRVDNAETVGGNELYFQGYRPQILFTAKRGWLNDPNGLIYLDGVYHLFFQYNPLTTGFESSMHWGHAVSKDLVHWEEKNIALFPDGVGRPFSGCTIFVDSVPFIEDGKKPAVLLFYTNASDLYTQNIAYSVDGLKTFLKYNGNPIVPEYAFKNRDPSVAYSEELGAYVMALFLEEQKEYSLLRSDNLLDWSEFQRMSLDGDGECPDLFQITASDGKKKWVLVSAKDAYLVGDFINGKFAPCQKTKRASLYSNGYAGRSSSNMPDGRVVRIYWIMWFWQVPQNCFSQQLSVVFDCNLNYYQGEYYLSSLPVKELESIEDGVQEFYDVDVFENCLEIKSKDGASFLEINGEYLTDNAISINYCGVNIELDGKENRIVIEGYSNPLSVDKKKLFVKIIADKSTVQVCCDDGKICFMICQPKTTFNQDQTVVRVKSEKPYKLEKIRFGQYQTIW